MACVGMIIAGLIVGVVRHEWPILAFLIGGTMALSLGGMSQGALGATIAAPAKRVAPESGGTEGPLRAVNLAQDVLKAHASYADDPRRRNAAARVRKNFCPS